MEKGEKISQPCDQQGLLLAGGMPCPNTVRLVLATRKMEGRVRAQATMRV